MSKINMIDVKHLEKLLVEAAKSMLAVRDACPADSRMTKKLDQAFAEVTSMVGLCQLSNSDPYAAKLIEGITGRSIQEFGVPSHYFDGTQDLTDAQDLVDKTGLKAG